MTLLPFLPLSAYREVRSRYLSDRLAAGATLPEARADFARDFPAAAAILARCNA